MKDCLIKKYKKSTNADLEVYGELLYEVPASAAGSADLVFGIGAIENGTISIDGDLQLWDYSKTTNYGSSYQNELPAPNSKAVKVVINGAGTIRVKSRYDVKIGDGYSYYVLYPTKYGYTMQDISHWYLSDRFSPNIVEGKSGSKRVPLTGNFADINYRNLPLANIDLSYVNVTGNLEDFIKYKDTLVDLKIFGSYIKGDIADLGQCINLVELNKFNTFADYKITGTVESFVAAQRAAGRDTASMSRFDVRGNDITFNGNLIDYSVQDNTLSWTANTITFNGETINA